MYKEYRGEHVKLKVENYLNKNIFNSGEATLPACGFYMETLFALFKHCFIFNQFYLGFLQDLKINVTSNRLKKHINRFNRLFRSLHYSD